MVISLFRLFTKLIVKRNKAYISGLVSILLTIVLIMIFAGLLDSLKFWYGEVVSKFVLSKLRNLQAVIAVAVFICLLQRYYRVILLNIPDYFTLWACGVSQYKIRLLIFYQTVWMTLLTVPAGLLLGNLAARLLVQSFCGVLHNYAGPLGEFRYVYVLVGLAILLPGVIINLEIDKENIGTISGMKG